MISQHFSFILAALLAFSMSACSSDSSENNTNTNNTGTNNTDANNTDNNGKVGENIAGKSFESTHDKVGASGAFDLEITDGSVVFTPALFPGIKLIASCYTFGKKNMDGFILGMATEGTGSIAQIVVRSNELNSWTFAWPEGVILNVPSNQVHTTIKYITLPVENEPLSVYLGTGGEVALTQLPFEADTDGFFHLKATSTINLDVRDQNSMFLRNATATWTIDIPFDESLEECFQN